MFPFRKKAILDTDSQARVVAAIKEAESNTTGEVRVFIEHHCTYMDALDRAKEIFETLAMSKTERRNAVLVYIALTDQQFAIFGDIEIYHKAGGTGFWQRAADKLRGHLRNNEITQGLVNCIHELGIALAQHFPHDPTVPKNELPDEIVFGK